MSEIKNHIKNYPQQISFAIGIFVVSLSIFVWADQLDWKVLSITNYQLFPLFGLFAFSLMWTHYIIGSIRIWSGFEKEKIKRYTKISGLLVLIALLLHPGLLVFQLYQSGLGLPPNSLLDYAGDAAFASILFGSIAWLAFMAYEFKDKLQDKSWWKYILMANAIAMILIFFHGLSLGQHLQTGWYKMVWFSYGITLILSMVYLVKNKRLF